MASVLDTPLVSSAAVGQHTGQQPCTAHWPAALHSTLASSLAQHTATHEL